MFLQRFDESSCVECGSDDFVVDRATCDEICRGCGIVRQTFSFDTDNGFCDHRSAPDEEDALVASVTGRCIQTNFAAFERPNGVSKSVFFECKKPFSSKVDANVKKFASIVRAKCHRRTGLTTAVHASALEIFDAFVRLCPDKCPKANVNGRNLHVYAAVCVQLATKIERCERTDVEMQNLFEVTPKRFSAALSHVLVSLSGHPIHSRISAMTKPLSAVPRILDALVDSLDDDSMRLARKRLSGEEYAKVERILVEGGSAGNVVVGALVHLASDGKARLEDISAIIGYSSTVLKSVSAKAAVELSKNRV